MLLAGLLVGCASAGARPAAKPAAAKRPAAVVASRPALPRAVAPVPAVVDGPAASGAPDPAAVDDAVPVPVPVDPTTRPYQVNGRTYVPHTEDLPIVERGLASWYGRRFHGRRTASGELYDMHAMTAAHPTLPLPSYVLVRNPANGREVVVRVNDRGPFHPGRIIDLSHVAAVKLGVGGLANVEVRRLTNDEIRTGAWRRDVGPMEGLWAAEDRRLALRRAEAQLAAAELLPVSGPPSTTVPGAVPTVVAAASAPAIAEAPLIAQAAASAPLITQAAASAPLIAQAAASAPLIAQVAASVPAPTVAAVAPSVRRSGPAHTEADSGRLPAPEGLVAAVPPAAGPASEPLRVAAAAPPVARGASSASGLALPVGLTGYWVQLGAFRVRDGAETFRRRVADEMAWIGPVLSVLSVDDLHRLQAGPYPSRDQAHGVAQRLREALRLAPVIVERQ